MLTPEIDENFFDTDTVTYKKGYKHHHYYQDNLVKVYDKNDIMYSIYKNKYNVYSDFNDKQKIFNTKFPKPAHNLTIAGNNLTEIKSLPKTLMSLWLQGIPKNYKMKKTIVPKGLVSIFYRWTDYTLGDDISHLKKLKVFGAPGNQMIFRIPKFPKSIEYVDLSNCQLGRFEEFKFNLKEYPNLKYLNISGNWIKKIPLELKKSGIKIVHGKQNK